MIKKIKTASLFNAFASLLLLFVLTQNPANAAACKGLPKSKCGANSACSWVGGYTTKKGAKVSAFCRNKPGSKKAAKKSGSSKPAKDKKKSSKTSRKEDKKK